MRPHSNSRLWALVFLAGGGWVGCANVLGLDGYEKESSGGSGGSGGTGSSGGSGGSGGTVVLESCSQGEKQAACAAAPPLGFQGPVVVTIDGGSCQGTWGDEALAGALNVDGPPAVCTCSCTADSAPTCASATVTTYAGANCMGIAGTNNVISSSCMPSPVTGFASAHAVTNGAACTVNATMTVPPVETDSRRVCSLALPAARESCQADSLCVPLPQGGEEPRICVYSAEAVASCPAAYPVLFELAVNGAVQDGRTCSTCECPATAPLQCAGSVRYATDAALACTQIFATVPLDGSCVAGGVGAITNFIVEINHVGPAVCTPTTMSEPMGEVEPGATNTLCCTPEILN